MATFFIADTHFGHRNIIKYVNRPFKDVVDMDETMIKNWNAVVGQDDVVYHLGDFSNHRGPRVEALFWRLNGTKILIEGNHDVENPDVLALPWAERHKMLEVVVDHKYLVLCHYPLMTWPRIGKEAWNLYGHVHGRLPGTKQSTDVGVDVFGFKPVTVSEIHRALKKNPDLPKWSNGREEADEAEAQPRPR